MDNFELAIKDYVTKIYDKDNTAIYHYELNRKFRVTTIRLVPQPTVMSGRRISFETPLGHFDNVDLAAAAHGVTPQTIFNRVRKRVEGYSYGKEK